MRYRPATCDSRQLKPPTPPRPYLLRATRPAPTRNVTRRPTSSFARRMNIVQARDDKYLYAATVTREPRKSERPDVHKQWYYRDRLLVHLQRAHDKERNVRLGHVRGQSAEHVHQAHEVERRNRKPTHGACASAPHDHVRPHHSRHVIAPCACFAVSLALAPRCACPSLSAALSIVAAALLSAVTGPDNVSVPPSSGAVSPGAAPCAGTPPAAALPLTPSDDTACPCVYS